MPSDGVDIVLKTVRSRYTLRGCVAAVLLAIAFVPVQASSEAVDAPTSRAPYDILPAPLNAPIPPAARSDTLLASTDAPIPPVGPNDDTGEERLREAALRFRYAGLVNTHVTAQFDGDRLFLPLCEMFDPLRVRCEFDRGTLTASGFFSSETQPYTIDFSSRTADVAGREYAFDDTDFVAENHDVYVTPALLETWFGLHFGLNAAEMTLSLRSNVELPVERMTRRSAQRPGLHDPYAAVRHAPLTYDRLRTLFGGGVLDYGFALSRTSGGTMMNLDAAVGAEVLGGDVRWRVMAGHAGAAYVNQSDFLWRYARDDERLSQVRVGTVYSTGLEPVAYHGVHLTNAPVVPKTYFADYVVAGEAPPDWEVELYLDDRLVGLGTAGADGRYRFTVPLFYGTSMIRVKTYGPDGEERHDLQRIQIPFHLLPAGELRYNVHAGWARNSSRRLAQADVGYGISDRLSVTAGIDAAPRFTSFRTSRGDADVIQTPTPYAGLTSRVGRHHLAAVDVSAAGHRRISFSGFYPSAAAIELQALRYARASALFVDGRRHSFQASGYAPFTIGHYSASARVRLARTVYDTGAQYTVGSTLYGGVRQLRFYLATRGDFGNGYRRLRLSPTASFTFTDNERPVLHRLSGLTVTARADYEAYPGRLERLHLDVGHYIRPRSRLSITLDAGLHGTPTTLGFRLNVDLPSVRATTSGGFRDHGSSITQSVRGSFLFDETSQAVHLDRRPVVGRSSAAVRLFVDEDGDGRYDAGEQIVVDDAVRLEHGNSGYKRRAGDATLLSGLVPYARYTVAIEEGYLSNPMLVPAQRSFSFIADPNAVKRIDVPLFAAGIVEGTVMKKDGETLVPALGASVRIIRREDGDERLLTTFFDGTFYEMGLPPGTYDITVVGKNETDAWPSSHTVILAPAQTGAIVDGLNFRLDAGMIPADRR